MYTQGAYLEKNPQWHTEDSAWKAAQIFKMLKRNNLKPKSVCEVGCGAGEILKQLQEQMDTEVIFRGFEISPQAFDLCQSRANEKLQFELADILAKDAHFDLLLAIDLIEHIEDYPGFLRRLKPKGEFKILHIPLELSAQTVLRESPILKARADYGHLHFFTRGMALAALRDAGYEVLDDFYTAWAIELPPKTFKAKLARLPRRLLFSISPDWAARILGGCSLMVLAR